MGLPGIAAIEEAMAARFLFLIVTGIGPIPLTDIPASLLVPGRQLTLFKNYISSQNKVTANAATDTG